MLLPLLALACSWPSPEAAAGGPVAPPAAEDVAAILAPSPAPSPPAWPAVGAVHPLDLPAGGLAGRLLLDAGHGAEGNLGNTNVAGVREADVMRGVADAVAPALAASGLVVTRTRPDAALVSYDDRLVMSRAADWLVSLHSDARAGLEARAVPGLPGTWETVGAPGFAVLYGDEGAEALVTARLGLARAVARRMAEAGFRPYDGADYAGLYAPDEVAGVFVDRHAPRYRIRLLRRPTVPSVIVETHEAHDREEAARWGEPATVAAFGSALIAALGDVGAQTGAPGVTPRSTPSPGG